MSTARFKSMESLERYYLTQLGLKDVKIMRLEADIKLLRYLLSRLAKVAKMRWTLWKIKCPTCGTIFATQIFTRKYTFKRQLMCPECETKFKPQLGNYLEPEAA